MLNSYTEIRLDENRNNMSSRRKGKPQQRKQPDSLMTKDEWIHVNDVSATLINGDDVTSRVPAYAQLDHLCKKLLEKMEPEQDLLTCGNCQREFLLSEILKFIQHKVTRCNKENVQPFDEHGGSDIDDNSQSAIISNRRTSISAPIAHKAAAAAVVAADSRDNNRDSRDKSSPRPSLSPHHEPPPPTGGATDGGGQNEADDKPTADVSCNTTYTEPVLLTCVACKSVFSSAWSLLQHAQYRHGVKLYHAADDDRPAADDVVKSESDDELKPGTPPPKLQPFTGAHSLQPSEKSAEREPGEHHRVDVPHSSSSGGGSSGSGGGITTAAGSTQSTFSFNKTTHPKSPINRSPSTCSSDVYNQSPPFQVPRQPLAVVTGFGPGGPFSRPPFSSDINHEIMDPFRRFSPFGALPPGLEHAVPGFPFRPPRCDGSMSLADYYSKRLQQLAHPSNFLNKSLPSFLSRPLSPFGQSVNSSQGSLIGGDSVKPLHTSKPLCEFCHKQFQSLSYLVIHRRRHTGEKPFKCPVCKYACSYATKLKKHMKFHSELKSLLAGVQSLPSEPSTNSDGSQRSNSSTPESKASNGDDKLENGESVDEDEFSEDTFIMREAVAEVTVRRIQDEWKRQQSRQNDLQNDQETEDNDDDDDDLSRDSLPNNKRKRPIDHESAENDGSTKDLSLSKEQRVEILSEVMKDTGFGRIKEFKEAYSEALKESGSRSKQADDDKDGSQKDKENIGDDGLPNSEPQRPNNRGSVGSTTSKSSGRSSSHADMDSPDNKKVKLEPQDGLSSPPSGHPFPNADIYHGPRDLFSSPSIWMPPHLGRRELMNIVLPTGDHPLFSGSHLQENGLHHDSALTSSPKPLLFSTAPPGISTSSPTSSLHGVPMAIRRRNDTCEFCGKVFKNCSNLTVHRRSHTGEKPYKCELCNYACAQSSKLTRHMRTHGRVGMDVFRCKFCNMPFSVASTLEKHMRRCVEKHQRDASVLPPAISPTGSLASSTASNV